MPFYNYECNNCFNMMEIQHGMKETPVIECSKCGSKTVEKVISLPYLNTHSGKTLQASQMTDRLKQRSDMRTDLRESCGIHEMTPTMPGVTFEHLYKEIKGNGKEVKATMDENRKRQNEQAKKRHAAKMQANAPFREQRIKAAKEEIAKRNYEKRAIDPIKKPKKD